jgi:hypothetical protein
LNFYLTVPALTLSDLLGISDQNGHYVAVALLMFASLWWTSAILRRHFDLSAGCRALLLCGVGLAVTLPTLDGIGQREQIMVMFFLPWAFHQASGRETIASAAFAAIGMCLKPHFICLPLAATLLNCLQDRSFRPIFSASNLVFLGMGLAYVGFVQVVHPAYFSTIVGLALEVYGAYGSSFGKNFQIIGYPLGLFALILFVGLRSKQMTRSAAAFTALAFGGLGSYFLQGTGFSYHKVPFIAFATIAGCLIILKPSRPGLDLIPAAIGLVGLAATGVQQGFYRNTIAPVIATTVRDLGRIDGMITLTSNMYSGPATAMALGADWASSYPANWLVPGAINRLGSTDCSREPETCGHLLAIAARNRTANIRDIDRLKPDLIVVDLRAEHFDRPGFDWLAFMDADPDWAPVFADYRQVAISDRFLYFLRNR